MFIHKLFLGFYIKLFYVQHYLKNCSLSFLRKLFSVHYCNETHIARFEYIYELTNKIYCGPIHCRIKSKPRINIRSMKDQTQMHFFGKFVNCKMGQIVRDVDKNGGFFSIFEDLKSKDI